jgi:hypothetical protein
VFFWRLAELGMAAGLLEISERKTLQRSDELRARQDPRHRTKKIEHAIWWWMARRFVKARRQGKQSKNLREYRALTKVYNGAKR